MLTRQPPALACVMPALVKSQAQSQLLFRNAEMDVRWRDDTITFTKRPGLLLWFALACVAAVGAFMLFDKIVAPSAAQQQFSTGVAKVLAGVGALFVALALAQNLVPRMRIRAVINPRMQTAQLGGRTVPFDAIAGYAVSPHLSNYSKLCATFTSGAAPFLLAYASEQQRAELEALQRKITIITGTQDNSGMATAQLAAATNRAFILIAAGIGTLFLVLGFTAFAGLGFRPVGGGPDSPTLPLWALGLPAYALAVAAWWSARSSA